MDRKRIDLETSQDGIKSEDAQFNLDEYAKWVASTTTQQPQPYKRPILSEETKKRLVMAAHRINSIKDQQVRLAYILAMVAENGQLVAEVNIHRAARGFELLPVYDPSTGKQKRYGQL